MIGYFPSLYEDELLYSWFARYHEHSGNISPKLTLRELFNNTQKIAVLDLPSNLLLVHQSLKHFNPPGIEQLIQKHTLFKYYTYFQTNEIRLKVLQHMKNGGKPGAVHLLLGIVATTVTEWRNIRFCPMCRDEELDKFGETYWHVSHQMPKVHYCLTHNELLLDTNIEIRNPHKHQFFSANLDYLISKDIKKSYSSKTEDYLKMVSSESYQLLLDQNGYPMDEIQRVYKYLLKRNGFANYWGNVDQQKLAIQFTQYYGEELLRLMDSIVNVHNESCWLKAITRKHRKSFHPIRHILFINFLGASIGSLKECIGKEYSPFGKSPYYCLNPVADHFKEQVVEDLTVTICTDTRKPVGTFKCQCGFIYSRRGPDTTNEKNFYVGRIKQFGEVWEDKLQELLKNELSYYEISKQMNCDTGTVSKYATSKKNTKEIKKQPNLKTSKEIEWLELLKTNTSQSITAIRKLYPALYAWHYRNNREWLKINSPKQLVERNQNKNIRVNWEKRDIEYLKEVEHIVEFLYSEEKPVFMNKTRVGKKLGALSIIEKHLSKLPKTKKFLEVNLETRSEFQIRRLLWSCNELNKNNEEIRGWKIRKMAGFGDIMPDNIEIAIKKVVEVINSGSDGI